MFNRRVQYGNNRVPILEYNSDLNKDERQLYTERLIKLHTILGQDTTTEYNHLFWTVKTRNGTIKKLITGHACQTSACAMGHALLHADEFPGLNKTNYTTDDLAELLELPRWQPLVPGTGAFAYFGPNSLDYIFNTNAYGIRDGKVHSPKRKEVMQRIEDYITTVLGCQLVEA